MLFLYSWIGDVPGTVAACAAASAITRSPALSQTTADRGLVVSGRGVLGVGVVHVQPGPVGQDDIGEAEVLVGQLGRVGRLRVRSNPRASRSGFSSSKSHRARRAGPTWPPGRR